MTIAHGRVIETTTSEIGTVLWKWGGVKPWRIVTPPDAFTLGYGNHSVDDLVETLKQIDALNLFVVDIRLNPVSDREEWNRDALLSRLSPRYYCHLPALGNRNYRNPYAGIALADPRTGLAYLRDLLLKGYTPVMLCACGEKSYDSCHRCTTAGLLTAEGYIVRELKPWETVPVAKPAPKPIPEGEIN